MTKGKGINQAEIEGVPLQYLLQSMPKSLYTDMKNISEQILCNFLLQTAKKHTLVGFRPPSLSPS